MGVPRERERERERERDEIGGKDRHTEEPQMRTTILLA